MKIWQADFYKRPLKDSQGQLLWELIICAPEGKLIETIFVPQSEATREWLEAQIKALFLIEKPDLIQIFRPQTLSLFESIGKNLGIPIEPTRRTNELKKLLQQRANQYTPGGEGYDPTKLEQPAPQPLPEKLWGDSWRFATILAQELENFISDRPIPIINAPESLLPLRQGIASATPIPGVVITGDKKSLQIARWLQENQPFSLNYIVTELGKSGGLVLESGLIDRWILFTFEDAEVARASQVYQQNKQISQGLHFLIIQPDDSGITYTGFWLLADR